MALSRLFTEVRLDLSSLAATTRPQELYPAIRYLARLIDEDCKQMGQAAPVVIRVVPPSDKEAWCQIDSDTELNMGEFMVLIGQVTEYEPSTPYPMVADGFEPEGLVEPVRPRSESDYRDALAEVSAETRTGMHFYLLHDCLMPNWDKPIGVARQLEELVSQFTRPTL